MKPINFNDDKIEETWKQTEHNIGFPTTRFKGIKARNIALVHGRLNAVEAQKALMEMIYRSYVLGDETLIAVVKEFIQHFGMDKE